MLAWTICQINQVSLLAKCSLPFEYVFPSGKAKRVFDKKSQKKVTGQERKQIYLKYKFRGFSEI